MTITSDDGTPSASNHEASLLLKQHWEPIFQAKDVNLRLANHVLGPFVQTSPPDIHWDLSFDEASTSFSSHHDSGCGPDGISYSFWANSPPPFQQALYDLYLYLKQGPFPNPSFNDANVVFPAKGKDPSDFGPDFSRHPRHTRPISLSNTDNKCISSLAAIPLSDLGACTVSPNQSGGLPCRQMCDKILDLESKAMSFLLSRSLLSGLISIDQAAAFPSISRQYIHWVLKKMRVPLPMRRLIRALYSDGQNHISIQNVLYDVFSSSTGVKQGCPSSMILFILAFDLIIRFIDSKLKPIGSLCFGYCDDRCFLPQHCLYVAPPH